MPPHLGRVKQFPDQGQQPNDLAERTASLRAVDNARVFRAAGVKAQKVRVMRDDYARLAPGKGQVPLIRHAKQSGFPCRRHVDAPLSQRHGDSRVAHLVKMKPQRSDHFLR